MTHSCPDETSRKKDWKIRQPSHLPSPVKLGISEIKRIASFFKLLIPVEHDALGIYNRARTTEDITTEEKLEELGAASTYLACKKHNLDFTDEQFEEAAGMKIEKIKECAAKIEKYSGNRPARL